MLSRKQEKLIKSLHTKKGREKHGFCLLEGENVISMAGEHIELLFSRDETEIFNQLMTTETPQDEAAIARIPQWSNKDLEQKQTIVVLDGVQDPGNVGVALRLCLAFDAGLLLIESADVASPKVIRSSAGAFFRVPWIKVIRREAQKALTSYKRPIYKLEKTDSATALGDASIQKKNILIAGSEGKGIQLKVKGDSVYIQHSDELESLNVGNALAIALYSLHQQ